MIWLRISESRKNYIMTKGRFNIKMLSCQCINSYHKIRRSHDRFIFIMEITIKQTNVHNEIYYIPHVTIYVSSMQSLPHHLFWTLWRAMISGRLCCMHGAYTAVLCTHWCVMRCLAQYTLPCKHTYETIIALFYWCSLSEINTRISHYSL